MSEILAEATFPSVIHNNEVCEEIVKWGNKNGFPLQKAKKRPGVFRKGGAFEYGKPRESGRERGPQRMAMVTPVSAARSPAV